VRLADASITGGDNLLQAGNLIMLPSDLMTERILHGGLLRKLHDLGVLTGDLTPALRIEHCLMRASTALLFEIEDRLITLRLKFGLTASRLVLLLVH
jgi:hypothetical protein